MIAGVVGRGSPDPAPSPTEGLPIHKTATRLVGEIEPAPGVLGLMRESFDRMNGRRPFGCPETRAQQFVGCSVSTDPKAPLEPVPTDHPTGLPGSTPRPTSQSPVQDEAIAPVAAQPSPQNEATTPTRRAAREVSMALVTALALLSSAGFGAAFGRSTDVTPRPSPISAHEPRGPRTTLPGGDPRGPGKLPSEGVTPTGRPSTPP
jgi:hypothetical protein